MPSTVFAPRIAMYSKASEAATAKTAVTVVPTSTLEVKDDRSGPAAANAAPLVVAAEITAKRAKRDFFISISFFKKHGSPVRLFVAASAPTNEVENCANVERHHIKRDDAGKCKRPDA